MKELLALQETVDRARQAQAGGAAMILRPSEVAAFVAAASLLAEAAEVATRLRPDIDLTALDPREPHIFAQVYAVGPRPTLDQAGTLAKAVMARVAREIFELAAPDADVQAPCDVES